MNRYKDAPSSVKEVFSNVAAKRFPKYTDLNFKFIIDTKRTITKGNLVFAKIELANDKVKFLSGDEEVPEGYDYILYINEKVWDYASDIDRERIIAHELCHVFIDEKGRLKIIDHDVQDFLSEINNNQDNPNWSIDLTDLVLAVYDQETDAIGV